MIASRSIRSAIRQQPCLGNASARQYSSIIRRNGLSNPVSSTSKQLPLFRSRSTVLALSISAIRHNSSTTTSKPTSELFESLPPSTSQSPETTDLFTTLSNYVSPDSTPHIGMLHEAGLNFGYGITSTVQWLTEHMYVYSGMPWWATLLTTTILIRASMFYPLMLANNETAKMAIIAPEMKAIKEKYQGMDISEAHKMQFMQQEIKYLQKKTDVKTARMFGPILVQGVIGFGSFRFLRNLGLANGVGLETGGFAWLQNLQIADPYYLVPLAMGATMHLVGRLGGEMGGSATLSPTMRNIMLYVLPGFIVVIMAPQSAALQLSMAAATFISLIQAQLFRSPRFRNWAGLLERPKPNKDAQSGGFMQMVNSTLGNEDMKKKKESATPAFQKGAQFGARRRSPPPPPRGR